MSQSVLFWRRTDLECIERLELRLELGGVTARSTVVSVEGGGFRLDHRWRLDADWRAQSVVVERWNADGHALVHLERAGSGWEVDGVHRADLDGAEEPDLSVTPFCNTLPIRRLPEAPGESLTLDVAYIDGATLSVERSRQRYEWRAPGRLRYVDLGLSSGFEATLLVDGAGLVVHYEHLFERLSPQG